MYSTWLRARLAAVATVAVFMLSFAVIGLVFDGPAQARGFGGGGFRGGGFRGGGFSRDQSFSNIGQSRTNVYAPHVDQNYNMNGGGWGYGWGGDGVGAAIAGAAVAGAVAGDATQNDCNPLYYGSNVYCD